MISPFDFIKRAAVASTVAAVGAVGGHQLLDVPHTVNLFQSPSQISTSNPFNVELASHMPSIGDYNYHIASTSQFQQAQINRFGAEMPQMTYYGMGSPGWETRQSKLADWIKKASTGSQGQRFTPTIGFEINPAHSHPLDYINSSNPEYQGFQKMLGNLNKEGYNLNVRFLSEANAYSSNYFAGYKGGVEDFRAAATRFRTDAPHNVSLGFSPEIYDFATSATNMELTKKLYDPKTFDYIGGTLYKADYSGSLENLYGTYYNTFKNIDPNKRFQLDEFGNAVSRREETLSFLKNAKTNFPNLDRVTLFDAPLNPTATAKVGLYGFGEGNSFVRMSTKTIKGTPGLSYNLTPIAGEFEGGVGGLFAGGLLGLLKKKKKAEESKPKEKIKAYDPIPPDFKAENAKSLVETAQVTHQAAIERIPTLPDSVRSLPMRGSAAEPGTLSMGRFGGYDVKPTRSSEDTWLESSREWERRRANKVEQKLNRISNPRQIVNEQRKLTAQSINERRAAARAARHTTTREETSIPSLQERLSNHKRNKPQPERLPDSVPALPQHGTSMPTSEYVKGRFGGYDVGPSRFSGYDPDFVDKSEYRFWEQRIWERKEEDYEKLVRQENERIIKEVVDKPVAEFKESLNNPPKPDSVKSPHEERSHTAEEALEKPLPEISKPTRVKRPSRKKPQAIHEAAKPENIVKEVHEQHTKTPTPPPTIPLPPNEAVEEIKRPKKSYRTHTTAEAVAGEATKEATETIARDISKDLIKGIRNEHLAIAGGAVAGASLLMMAFGKFQHKGKVYKHPMTGRQARAQKRGRDAASAAGALGLVSLTNKRFTPIGRRNLFFGSMWGLGTMGDGLDGNVSSGIVSNTLATAAAYSAMLFVSAKSGKGLSALKDSLHSNDFRGVSNAFKNVRKLFPLVDREMVGYMAAAGTFPVAHSIIQQTLMGHSRNSNKVANPTLMANSTAGLEYKKDDTVPFKGIGPVDLNFNGSISTSYNSQVALQSFR